MSEEAEEQSIISAPASELVEKISPELSTAISSVESHIAEADHPQKAAEWAVVRGKLLQQDETIKDIQQQRSLARVQTLYNLGLSTGSFIIGMRNGDNFVCKI